MFVLVILGVAAVAKSVPVEPSKKVTDDATLTPKLQLAFLVEDVEYQPSQLQKLQQKIARSGKNFAEKSQVLKKEDNEIEDGHGRRRRSTPSEDPFRSQLEEGYYRRRRSPQNTQNQVLPLHEIESQDDQIAVESESRVSALNIANILKIAGAEATPINRQGGYGRKRRSPMDSSSNDFDSLEISENLQSVSPRGGSDKRRKRSTQKEPAQSSANQHGLVDNPDVVVKPHGKYGDLQKILALSGAKPQPISRGVSYGRRKKRSPQDLSNEIITNEIQTGPGLVKDVAIEAVKIKSHGNYGNIAQVYDAGANSKNVVVNGRYGRRKREDNFIPFNVYDERRVKTLKIEQNDFLALPMRLQIEKDSSDRIIKKRQFAATQ